MQRSRSSSFDSITPRMRARPAMAGLWLGAALGLTLGLATTGCRFEPAGQGPDGLGPGPAVDAAQPLDGRQPLDAGSAPAPDAAPAPLDGGGAQRPTLPAYPVEDGDIQIDGDLEDWDSQGWQAIAAPAAYRPEHDPASAGAGDLSLRFAARWHPDRGLYLAFEVTDDVHAVDNGNNDVLWRGDSVQTGFDVGLNGGNNYDATDDFEYGWALAGNGQPREHRWVQSNGAPFPATEYRIVRSGTTTTYEIRMPPSNLALVTFAAGRRIGFSVIVNDDEDDFDVGDRIRDGWLEWTPGIAVGKLPGMFGVLDLREETGD
jgi:hypothetical protein